MSLQNLSNQNNLETLRWQKTTAASNQAKKITIWSERLQGSSEKNSDPRPSVTFRSEAHTQQDGCTQHHYCGPHRLTEKYSQHRNVLLRAIAGWQALPVKQQSHPRPGRRSDHRMESQQHTCSLALRGLSRRLCLPGTRADHRNSHQLKWSKD